jgi:hypothetical protein
MKSIALIAAAGSLAAMTAPAAASENAPGITNFSPASHTAMIAPFGANLDFTNVARYDDDDWDDDDRRWRRGRGWRDDRAYDRRGRYYEPRRLRRGDRVWRGRDGRYYCERGNGTTGLVVGAGVGALLGRTIDTRGDRTVGTLLGGALGAVLGREIDRGGARCR